MDLINSQLSAFSTILSHHMFSLELSPIEALIFISFTHAVEVYYIPSQLRTAIVPNALKTKLLSLEAKIKLVKFASPEYQAQLHANVGLIHMVKHMLACYKEDKQKHLLAMETEFKKAVDLVPNHYLYHYYEYLWLGKTANSLGMEAKIPEIIKHIDYVPPKKSALRSLLAKTAGTFYNLICFFTTCCVYRLIGRFNGRRIRCT